MFAVCLDDEFHAHLSFYPPDFILVHECEVMEEKL